MTPDPTAALARKLGLRVDEYRRARDVCPRVYARARERGWSVDRLEEALRAGTPSRVSGRCWELWAEWTCRWYARKQEGENASQQ